VSGGGTLAPSNSPLLTGRDILLLRWNVSYMNAVKNFRDNWATSYLK